MSFFGDALGAYMLPRVALELLQQPGAQQQCGVSAEAGFAWILSGDQLYIWRYREGKEARLRVLTLPRPAASILPCSVALIAHGSAAPPPPSSGPLAALMTPAAISPPSASDGPLTVAVCDSDGRLTVWLDAHHLASPVEHQLLIPAAGARAPGGSSSAPLVASFAACRLDLGAGPAFLATLSATDGSLYMLQVGAQGIFTKQLAAPTAAAEPRGLVGALGSVLSRAYTDAFDPSARYIRRTPSSRPALALHVAPAAGGGGQHFRLLVLTADSLDCWTISVGLRPSESLQWSFLNCLVRQHDKSSRGAGSVVNLDLAVAGPRVALWINEAAGGRGTAGGATAAAEERPQHVVQMLELMPEAGPVVLAGVHDVVAGYKEPEDTSTIALRRLLFTPASNTCLLVRWQLYGSPHSGVPPSRVCKALWSWCAATGTGAPLLEDPDTAAVDVAPSVLSPHDGSIAGDAIAAGAAAGRWVVLSATYGVVELSATAPAAAAVVPVGDAAAAAAAAGLDPAAAISNLLDAVLSQAAAIAAAGGNLQPLVSSLHRRLAALGALGSGEGQSTLALYSTQLLDLLPKQWAGGEAALQMAAGGSGGGAGFGGGALSVSVSEQLTEKEVRHAVLLQCLALSGVLHALEPEVQRVLIENSEKLAVAAVLHRLQTQQRDTQLAGAGAAAAAGAGGPTAAAAALLSRLVSEAGQESSAKEYEVLSPAEIFYARPSVSVGHFLGALGRAAATVTAQAARGSGNPGDSDLGSLRSTVRELGSLVAVAVNAAVCRRDQLAAAHHLVCHEVAARLGRPDWLAGENTRAALIKLAEAIQAVRPSQGLFGASMDLSRTLYGVTDVLLTCFSAAVASTRDPGARSALLAEYRAVRGRCSEELLRDALAEMKQRIEETGQRTGAPPPDLLIWQLEALCRAHHCYPQLFEVCEALAAADPAQASRLYTHMATVPPEEGPAGAAGSDPAQPGGATTLAGYVFGRLLTDGRFADLLDLPPQFHAGVTAFLQSRLPATSDLLATHLLRSGAFADAAAVLHTSVAGAGSAESRKAVQVSGEAAAAGAGCLGGHLRLLSVARLAARAGGAAEMEVAAVRELKLLELQASLGRSADGPPMEPAVLLEEALARASAPARSGSAPAAEGTPGSSPAKEAAVVAVAVLALMSSTERAAHASKWQLAWKAVYEGDPWDQVAAARAAATATGEGSAGEGAWREALAGTAVCRAAAACAGTDALGFGATVVDSAPLDQVARWLRTWALSGAGAGAGSGARGSSPVAAAAAAASDPASERRVGAVMAALQLGVEGAAATAAATTRGREAAAAGGPLDMVIG